MADYFGKIILRLGAFDYRITRMNIEPVAIIKTPFSEKFTIPRQADIVRQAVGKIYLTQTYCQTDSVNGLASHSHYWLIWGFHAHVDKKKPLNVRPPRLGGNKRVGFFSTRSPFRPNNLGLSVVKLEDVDKENFVLTVSGVDMLDDSPIYDIKPYVPYADAKKHAISTWANDAPLPVFRVNFLSGVKRVLENYDQQQGTSLLLLISELLSYDARPAYKAHLQIDEKIYGTRLYDMEIKWRVEVDEVTVISAQEVVK